MVISIFYNQEYWHELIKKLLKPFLEQESDDFENWNIYLSTYRGDHVTIVFSLKGNSDFFKEKFLNETRLFLTEFPSAIKEVKYPLDNIFQDFQNNSVEFDVDPLPIDFASNGRFAYARQQFSEIITDVLGEEEIDIESVFTFLIYLQLGIIKTGFSHTKIARINTLKLLLFLNTVENDSERFDSNSNLNKQFIELFEYNKTVFVEIIEDIWNPGNYDEELKWMKKWENVCHMFLPEIEFQSAFVLLSKMAYDHLGINGNKIQNSCSREILKIFNQVTKNLDNVIRIA